MTTTPGAITKKGDKYYVVVSLGKDENGRRVRKWHGSWATKREAGEALKDILGRQSRGEYVAPKRQTVREFVEQDWLPTLQLRPSTIESYRRNLRIHVLPRIGHLRLQSVDAGHLNKLYADLLAEGGRGDDKAGGLSLRTVRYIHTIIQSALGSAEQWGRIARSPAAAATPPRAKDALEAAPAMVTWSGAQMRTFLDETRDEKYGPAWYFLATTGMRRGEALGLLWSDVDLEAGTVTIRRALIAIRHKVVEGSTKSGKARKIRLDAGTVAVLRKLELRQRQDRWQVREGYRPSGHVFVHEDGTRLHPDRFSREFERRQDRYARQHPEAPLPRLRLHDLRHTWATLALEAGEHPKVVAERLGHSSIAITLNTYSHVTEALQSQAAENVAALIFGA